MSITAVPSFADRPNLTASPTRLFVAVLFALILLAAAALRLYDIGQTSFWFEELLAVEQSTGMGRAMEHPPDQRFLESPRAATALHGAAPIWRIWTTRNVDGQPPLHLVMLRLWRTVFGENDVSARLLSTVLSLVSIALLFVAVQTFHGTTAALWASALMAMAGPQIDAAQSASATAMLATLSLAVIVSLVRIEAFGLNRRRGAAFALCSTGALLTHYGAIPAVLCAAVYGLLRLRGRDRSHVVGLLALSCIVAALAWGPFALSQHAIVRPSAVSEINVFPADSLGLIGRWLSLPSYFLVDGAAHPQALALICGILYAVPLLLLRKQRGMLLWCLWLLAMTLPIAAMDAMYATSALRIVRYTLPAAPAAYAILASMLTNQPGYRRHIVPIVLLISCVLSLPSAYMRWREDWRGFGQYMASVCRPGDAIVLFRKEDEDSQADALYLTLSHYLPHAQNADGASGDLLVPLVILRGRVTYPLLQKINSAQRVWLVNADRTTRSIQLFPGGTVNDERHFLMLPHAMDATPATVVRVQPTPLGIPFID